MNVFTRRMYDVLEQQVALSDLLLANKKRLKPDGTPQDPKFILSYVYATTFLAQAAVAIATNTGIQNTIQTAGDSDFLATYISSQTYNNATQANIASPYARFLLKDNSSQRDMMNEPLFLNLASGSGGFPYLLQDPKLFPANTNILLTFYNCMTVGPIVADAQFAIGGYRVFY